MTLNNAKFRAKADAKKNGLTLAIVREKYPDEHEVIDADGFSYGYCPRAAVALCYIGGEIVEEVMP